jgi:hypothetical protein
MVRVVLPKLLRKLTSLAFPCTRLVLGAADESTAFFGKSYTIVKVVFFAYLLYLDSLVSRRLVPAGVGDDSFCCANEELFDSLVSLFTWVAAAV